MAKGQDDLNVESDAEEPCKEKLDLKEEEGHAEEKNVKTFLAGIYSWCCAGSSVFIQFVKNSCQKNMSMRQDGLDVESIAEEPCKERLELKEEEGHVEEKNVKTFLARIYSWCRGVDGEGHVEEKNVKTSLAGIYSWWRGVGGERDPLDCVVIVGDGEREPSPPREVSMFNFYPPNTPVAGERDPPNWGVDGERDLPDCVVDGEREPSPPREVPILNFSPPKPVKPSKPVISVNTANSVVPVFPVDTSVDGERESSLPGEAPMLNFSPPKPPKPPKPVKPVVLLNPVNSMVPVNPVISVDISVARDRDPPDNSVDKTFIDI